MAGRMGHDHAKAESHPKKDGPDMYDDCLLYTLN